MILVEKHIIKKTNLIYNELNYACFLSKNLYNAALYEIRQYFFNTKKYLNKYELTNKFTKKQQVDYIALPRKVSQWVISLVDQNFKSFFKLLKKKQFENYDKKVKLPKYLNKLKGRQILTFTNQAISLKSLKNGKLKLSGFNFEIPIKHTNIQQVRIIPRNNFYVIEILYNIQEKPLKENNNRYASIDLGLNNLAAVSFNCLQTPIIINGKPLKSINQYFNKKLAKFKSIQDFKNNKNIFKNKIYSLSLKRNNKINDYLHKSSRYLINHLVSNNINTLIIGLNKEWKQEINIGKNNNQKFVQIPHSKFIDLLKYKAKLEGINIIIREESYTSKCSFIDNEEIKKHKEYLGKRIKRGLFKSALGKIINADLNGSLNILRKEVPNAFSYGIEVCNTPLVISL